MSCPANTQHPHSDSLQRRRVMPLLGSQSVLFLRRVKGAPYQWSTRFSRYLFSCDGKSFEVWSVGNPTRGTRTSCVIWGEWFRGVAIIMAQPNGWADESSPLFCITCRGGGEERRGERGGGNKSCPGPSCQDDEGGLLVGNGSNSKIMSLAL